MYSLIDLNNSKQCPWLLFWNEKSAEYFTKALNIQLALEDHLTTLETFNNMAQYCKEQYLDASKDFQNALQEARPELSVIQTKSSDCEAEISYVKK